jgi:hypothetical protein
MSEGANRVLWKSVGDDRVRPTHANLSNAQAKDDWWDAIEPPRELVVGRLYRLPLVVLLGIAG